MTLILSDISIKFRHPVLAHLSAQFMPGNVYLIIGENGSGKTTLLRAIAGLVPIDAGGIRLQDRTMSNWGLDWYNHVAWVADFPPISPDLTVSEMIRLAQVGRQVTVETIHEAIKMMALDFVMDTPCGELSLGFRQRVSIALATAGPRSVVVMDEPTQGVDAETITRVQLAIRQWADRGAIVLIASHDVAALTSCADQVFRLCNGNLIPEGLGC